MKFFFSEGRKTKCVTKNIRNLTEKDNRCIFQWAINTLLLIL